MSRLSSGPGLSIYAGLTDRVGLSENNGLSGGSGGSSFNPASIPNLMVWADPADTATVTVASDVVSQINDKSGNSYNFTSATASQRPGYGATWTSNGKNLLHGDGVNDGMNINSGLYSIGTGPFTLFMVTRKTIPEGQLQPFYLGSLIRLVQSPNSNNLTARWNTAAVSATLEAPGDVGIQVFCLRRTGSSLFISLNGGTEVTAAATDVATAVAGSAAIIAGGGNNAFFSPSSADFGDIIGYSRSLSSSEISYVVDGLRSKWFAPLPQQLARWNAALAGQAANTYRPRLLCIGDSTTRGVGSGNPDIITNSYPTQLATILTGQGRDATAQSFIGGGGQISGDVFTGDPRIAITGAWAKLIGTFSIGGIYIRNNNTTDFGTFTFTPVGDVDTIKYYAYSTSGTPVTVATSLDGAADVNQVIPGISGGGIPSPVTITTTLGPHSLAVKRAVTFTNDISVAAMEAYDSTKYQISVLNAGWPSAQSVGWNGIANGYAPSPAMAADYYNPDLTIVQIGINDWISNGGPVTLEQFRLRLRAIINNLINNSDVVIASPIPSAITSAPLATQQSFVDVMEELATEYNLLFIDVFSYFGSYEIRDPQGWYADDLHGSALGYSEVANYIADRI